MVFLQVPAQAQNLIDSLVEAKCRGYIPRYDSAGVITRLGLSKPAGVKAGGKPAGVKAGGKPVGVKSDGKPAGC